MTTKSKVPQVRFKGFSGEWEEKRLGNIYNFQYGQFNVNPSNNGIYPVYGANGVIGGYSNFNSENAVIIGHMGEYAGSILWGRGKHFVTYNGTISVPKDNRISPKYGYYMLTQLNIQKVCAGSGQPFLAYNTLEKLNTIFPISIKEQTKIGNYFQNLDKLIEQKEKKHKKLKQLKKAMLEKMFPKDSENTPDIRFKGFSGEWEEKKLEELCTLITKGTTPFNKSSNGSINFIKIENINSLSGKIKITTKISKDEHENYLKRSQLKENDILFSIAGTLGRITIIQKEVLPANTNQALAIIRLKEKSLDYITTYLKGRAVRDYIKKNPTVGAQPNLSLEQIGNIKLSLPNLEEQTKIGNYFQKLDKLIDLQLQELEKLKNIKKASLDKMFV